ncbi:hypothetical protein NDU88_004157 [Pleurodeles waltl]|uniref:Uncharacterized protein n=1 Tax=Pleurodeles waltl TaxID=8319 RepID=A0AAV7VJ44_PLEWA|nr:hypothetical protein NDU88_004157 [Pleurodeles waltl]
MLTWVPKKQSSSLNAAHGGSVGLSSTGLLSRDPAYYRPSQGPSTQYLPPLLLLAQCSVHAGPQAPVERCPRGTPLLLTSVCWHRIALSGRNFGLVHCRLTPRTVCQEGTTLPRRQAPRPADSGRHSLRPKARVTCDPFTAPGTLFPQATGSPGSLRP